MFEQSNKKMERGIRKEMKCPRCFRDTMKRISPTPVETFYKCYECGCWGYQRTDDNTPELEKIQ